MDTRARLSTSSVIVVAMVLGLLVALSDVASPFGDDSAQFTVLLWLVSSGVLGFARPDRAWQWALAIGPWTPLTHLVLRLLGRADSIHPDAYMTILILFPVSLAACLVGAYGGALARRLFLPKFPSARAGVR